MQFSNLSWFPIVSPGRFSLINSSIGLSRYYFSVSEYYTLIRFNHANNWNITMFCFFSSLILLPLLFFWVCQCLLSTKNAMSSCLACLDYCLSPNYTCIILFSIQNNTSGGNLIVASGQPAGQLASNRPPMRARRRRKNRDPRLFFF